MLFFTHFFTSPIFDLDVTANDRYKDSPEEDHQGDPFGVSPGLKTNYMVYIYNFKIKRPILDLDVSLVRAYQDINICLHGKPPRGDFYFYEFK